MRLDEASLARWGERIGETVETPVVLGLQGELGAGKSVLARAIGKGAGVSAAMPSPSFNLVFRYPAGLGREVVHLDLYRVAAPDELWELGWQSLGAEHEIVIVEWPERAEKFLPRSRWEVSLRFVEEDDRIRGVAVTRFGVPPHLPGFPVTVTA